MKSKKVVLDAPKASPQPKATLPLKAPTIKKPKPQPKATVEPSQKVPTQLPGLELLEEVAKGGSTITILELIVSFSLKKALYANWILITNFQLFIFINDWSVVYPKNLQALMMEFRRITLGEFVLAIKGIANARRFPGRLDA